MKLLKSLARIFLRHLRVGYVSGLAVFDAVAITMLGIDVLRYASLGRSVTAALILSASDVSYESISKAIVILISFVLVAPIANAIVLSYVGTSRLTRIAFGKLKVALVLTHLLSTIVIALSAIMFDAMQTISGYQIISNELTYSFDPIFQPWLVRLAYLPYAALPVEVLFAFIFGLSHKAAETGRLQVLYDYSTRLILADLRGDLHPLGGRKKLNFNTAAIAPEIRYIKQRTHDLVEQYQNFVPGSTDAEQCLSDTFKEVNNLIRRLLVRSSNDVTVEILPGTSRALEIAISKLENLHTVILSPFEHPVEAKVVEWMKDHSGTGFEKLTFQPSDYFLPWNEQEELVLSKIEQLQLPRAYAHAFLVSQVCYATGQVIPVGSLIQKIRQRIDGADVKFIIDAAHYVGNGRGADEVDIAESYVFSTHKWLLSPEPAGVILGCKNELRSYDAWHSSAATSLPYTTASVRSIMGLRASLELINRVGLENLFMRSAKLRDYFADRVGLRFQVVGDKAGLPATFMLSIRPRPGYHWKYPDANSLREYFKGQSTSILVLSIDPNTPWVRLSFPYFLEVQQVRLLLNILGKAITSD